MSHIHEEERPVPILPASPRLAKSSLTVYLLWFLWTLAIFFIIGRFTVKFMPITQVAAAAAVSLIWMSLVEPALPGIVYSTIGSGWHGIFRYYFLFIGFALFSQQIRDAASLFILSLLGVAGGIGLANLIGGLALLRYFGRQTLPIYLAHSAIIATFLCEITALGLTPALTFNLYLAVVALSCVVIANTLGLSQLKPLKYMYNRPTFSSERVTPPSKQSTA